MKITIIVIIVIEIIIIVMIIIFMINIDIPPSPGHEHHLRCEQRGEVYFWCNRKIDAGWGYCSPDTVYKEGGNWEQ